MEKLNLVEILKDCPKGTKFYSPVYGKIEFIGIETFASSDPITIKWFKDENTTYLEYLRADGTFRGLGECIIFPSEDQRDWSKWQRPFVKGDVLVSEAGNIVLCSHIDENQLVHYHCLLNFLDILKIRDDIGVGYSHECTLANDFQKQKLFDALKKEGYEWDAEKKELKPLQEFKDGDIVTYGNQIAIFKKYIFEDSNLAECYVFLDNNLEMDIDGNYYVNCLATEQEKQKLFTALKDNGYRWNTETKTLEKLIEPKFKVGDKVVKKGGINIPVLITEVSDENYYSNTENSVGFFKIKEQDNWELVPNKFDTKTLRPFDKVLVRQYDERWHIQFFETMYEYDKNHPFRCLGGKLYSFCIPYIGNEHLLDTIDEPSEFYRYWEE